ncbi:uncharacterized protein V1510DRAFT_415217 [Dipodascopsis tothii]|uniref:uncharacterized protein n=1 Tax=Dipodascopsis tothii TaxID=44089 RepID=UPI0034CE99CB
MPRLRQAWKKRFPQIDGVRASDSDSDADIVYLDEQEQDELIAGLRAENDAANRRFQIAFETLAVVQMPMFLVHPALRSAGPLLISLALTVLGAAAYVMHAAGSARAPRPVATLNLVLGGLVVVLAYIRLRPFFGADYLWLSPLGSHVAVLLAREWMKEGDVASLESFRYKYKGA